MTQHTPDNRWLPNIAWFVVKDWGLVKNDKCMRYFSETIWYAHECSYPNTEKYLPLSVFQ